MKTFTLALIMVASLGASAGRAGDAATLRMRDTRAEGWILQGAEDDRYEWLRGGGLELVADSTEPSARLLAPLPFTLDGTSSFRLEIDATLDDIDASPDDFFQLSLGLVSSQTTGLNRTGTSIPVAPFFVDDCDVFDSVEVAYFPNVTFFGGPFLQPSVFGAQAGSSAFWNFAANFGPSSDLGDNTGDEITELPQGTPLRFVLEHDACSQSLVTRVLDLSGAQPLELATGLEPLDLAFLDATGTFTVDSFAVNAYLDAADYDPSTVSLRARVRVDRASIERRAPIEAKLLPSAVNASASADAHVRVRNASPGAEVRLVEVNGVATDEPLDARATGDGLLVRVSRVVATAPFAISVGGCRLDLAPERVVAP